MMMICTAGTSIAQGLTWRNDAEEYRTAIRARLAGLARSTDFAHRASAESHSIERYGAGRLTRVALLHSETDDGGICAEELAALVGEHFGLDTQLVKIAGLQVDDARRFRRTGIQGLFGAISALHRDAGQVVLNATGGFKSVVPYITLYGLLYRIPVIYVFERSAALIELPSAAVGFDYERIARARTALMRLRQQGAMAKDDFFAVIPGLVFNERDAYESLLEEEDGLVTASAFAHLLMPVLDQGSARVMISPSVRVALAQADGQVRERFVHMLDNIGSPLWRAIKIHAFRNSELLLYRKGMATSERLGAFFRGGSLYVAELWRHDEYEREAPKCRIAEYDPKKFTVWQRTGAGSEEPWVPPDELADGGQSKEEMVQALAEERRRRADLARQHDDTVRNAARTAQERSELMAKLGKRGRELAQESTLRVNLQQEVDTLRAQLSEVSGLLEQARSGSSGGST